MPDAPFTPRSPARRIARRSPHHATSRRALVVVAAMACPAAARAQPTEAPAPSAEPSPTSPAAAPPAAPTSAPPGGGGADANATSGFHNGIFFLRSRDDVFRLYVQGRVHVDFYQWLGPGVTSLPSDTALKSTVSLRRVRTELAGEFFERWQWQLGAEFGPSAVDNPGGNTAFRSCTPDATTGAMTCTDRQSAVEAAGVRPIPTDAFVNLAAAPLFNVQVGQYYLPFSLENRISDNTMPFLERSLPVRAIGAPTTRDIGAMLWGESPDRVFYYAASVVDGDGPNRPNEDSRYDFVGRALVRPLASTRPEAASLFRDLQIGASARYGSRDPRYVGYDLPSLTTQSGYAFWKPTYRDSAGRIVHVLPSGEQGAIGADLLVPIDGFDLTGEVIYAITNTREAIDGYQLSPFTERTGTLKGYGYYVQLGAWLIGSRDIIGGTPSYARPLHVDLSKPQRKAEHGLQVLAKVERLALTYDGAARSGVADAKTPNGDVDVTSLEIGANFWATRHLRVGINYAAYLFPNSEPTTPSAPGGPVQTSAQRAIAPGQYLAKGVDDAARDGGHAVHEIAARVGVQF